jgi:hypothetical protein
MIRTTDLRSVDASGNKRSSSSNRSWIIRSDTIISNFCTLTHSLIAIGDDVKETAKMLNALLVVVVVAKIKRLSWWTLDTRQPPLAFVLLPV